MNSKPLYSLAYLASLLHCLSSTLNPELCPLLPPHIVVPQSSASKKQAPNHSNSHPFLIPPCLATQARSYHWQLQNALTTPGGPPESPNCSPCSSSCLLSAFSIQSWRVFLMQIPDLIPSLFNSIQRCPEDKKHLPQGLQSTPGLLRPASHALFSLLFPCSGYADPVVSLCSSNRLGLCTCYSLCDAVTQPSSASFPL